MVGYSEEQLLRQITVLTVPGVTYKFRYRVKNIFGFCAGYSPEVEFKSAKEPDTPSDLLTSISGRNIKIQWTAQSENYDPITRYEIQV